MGLLAQSRSDDMRFWFFFGEHTFVGSEGLLEDFSKWGSIACAFGFLRLGHGVHGLQSHHGDGVLLETGLQKLVWRWCTSMRFLVSSCSLKFESEGSMLLESDSRFLVAAKRKQRRKSWEFLLQVSFIWSTFGCYEDRIPAGRSKGTFLWGTSNGRGTEDAVLWGWLPMKKMEGRLFHSLGERLSGWWFQTFF